MLYTLERSQTIHATPHEAWTFFSNLSNLCDITPGWLRFNMTCPLPQPMYAGQILTYALRPIPGWTVEWVTEITHVREPLYFVDEQRAGPYSLWHHEHIFKPIPHDETLMIDRVSYRLPFGPLGRLVHTALVRRRLDTIFDFRHQAIDAAFPEKKGAPEHSL